MDMMIRFLRSSRTLCSSVETAEWDWCVVLVRRVYLSVKGRQCAMYVGFLSSKHILPCVVYVGSLLLLLTLFFRTTPYSLLRDLAISILILLFPHYLTLSSLASADADAVRRKHAVPEGSQGCLQRPGQPGRRKVQDGGPDRLLLRPVRVLACCWCTCGVCFMCWFARSGC
jgi:hypothetical protein